MMMALDQFAFSLDTLAYQELQRQTSWKHPTTPRAGARDSRQFTGPGDDTITVTGTLMPNLIGSPDALDELRAMGDLGDAYALVDGVGKVYGAFVIEGVGEAQTHHDKDGQPAHIEFSLALTRVDDHLAGAQGQDEFF